MAAAPVVFAVAVALFAASANAFIAPSRRPPSYYTTSPLFDDLVQPLCTESPTDDACYGCFARFARMRQAPAAYEELKKCAREYLNGTSYEECQAVIGDDKVSKGGQSPVFCEFEKCVRKRDMLQLVDACAKQNDNSQSEVEKYIQTTSCIIEEMQRRNFKVTLYGAPTYFINNLNFNVGASLRLWDPHHVGLTEDGSLEKVNSFSTNVIQLSGPRYPGVFASQMTYALYVTEVGELRVMSTYGGANDQFSCEPTPSPLAPIPVAADGPAGAF